MRCSVINCNTSFSDRILFTFRFFLPLLSSEFVQFFFFAFYLLFCQKITYLGVQSFDKNMEANWRFISTINCRWIFSFAIMENIRMQSMLAMDIYEWEMGKACNKKSEIISIHTDARERFAFQFTRTLT